MIVPPMAAVALALAAAVTASSTPASGRRAHHARKEIARAEVILAGERVPVRWTDGDTFRVLGGRFDGRAARLMGVNALETFGPVHRIGAMSPAALYAIAKATAPVAAARVWTCDTDGALDGYGRLLASCPDAAEALVRGGWAMVFALDAPPAPGLLEAQRAAQASRAGIWAGGVPPLVPTSLHSADEPDLGPRGAYDRVADTRTGVAAARPHARVYRPCEERCVGEGPGRACLVYVPFDRRYRHRPACLR